MRPKKSLSQNFLTNDKAARRIVESLNPGKDDTVLEIGAGKGALTKHLLEKSNRVLAVEIDKQLCRHLQRAFGQKENLFIINQDILKIDFADLIKPAEKCKVVGNLPYRITSPVLSLLLRNRRWITLCVLMVQKDVALRICAVPGNKDWSPLSVAVQLHFDVKTLFHLKPGSFYPPPRVDSTVIRLDLLPQPKAGVPDEEFFLKVVRAAFGQRRKTVLNSMGANLDLPKRELEIILRKVKIDPLRRAETLSLDEFADLAYAIIGL